MKWRDLFIYQPTQENIRTLSHDVEVAASDN